MRIVARSTLVRYLSRHAPAKLPLEAWYSVCSKAKWTGPADVKATFGMRVDFLPRNRMVFNVGGNNYRVVVVALFRRQVLYIRFIGTHAEYDEIDATTI